MVAVLWAGAGGSALFAVVFLLDGWTRPGYHPVRHAVSALALGQRGWMQAANFIVCGLLISAAAAAVVPAVGSLWLAVAIAVFGLSLVASGVFPMDAMRGYPPGAPDGTPREVSFVHRMHDWAGAVVFISLPAAELIAVFAVDGIFWKAYSAATAVASAGLTVRFSSAWEADDPRTGLIQRAAIIVGWLWLALLLGRFAVQSS